MNLAYAGLSDTGLIRNQNEDNWYADTSSGLFIVADGMGGHRSGDTASGLIVEYFPHLIQHFPLQPNDAFSGKNVEHLRAALEELNSYIYQHGVANNDCYGMGATAVVLLISDSNAIIGHMGDSRLYSYRDKQLDQVTHDHSITQYLIDLGEISHEEASSHQSKGRISQYFGMPEDPVPEVLLMELEVGDRLLLCSDGLNTMLSDQQICKIMTDQNRPEDACSALIDAANQAGGKDNITTIVIDVTR